MKKINIDIKWLKKISKKNYIYALFMILAAIFIIISLFSYNNLKASKIEESAITSHEEKIDEGLFNKITENDKIKKQRDTAIFDQLKNPF